MSAGAPRYRGVGRISLRVLALMALATVVGTQALAGEVRVAVASNFAEAMTDIAQRFEASTGHNVKLSSGSTGKHYAQIRNGAPFDLFFAADARRPDLLERAGLAKAGSRFTYAVGKLVLWSPDPNYVDAEGKILEQGDFRHLAIANPKLAPYGRAAQEVLEGRGLWHVLSSRIVRGENIGQAYQFIKSGNAELGFVAYSQIKRPDRPPEGSVWDVPQSSYSPIEQQAVLINDNDAARAFLSFVRQIEISALIREYGYRTP
jgi:molybdate transport system substrate-binding protein